MIAIDVTMVPVGAGASIQDEYTIPLFIKEHVKIMAFFQDCVDQSLILNLIVNWLDQPIADQTFDTTSVTTYFSLDMEKALLFEQKFQNVTAEFSMKKFWNQSGLDTTIAFREINLDQITDTRELINQELCTIWGVAIEA
jgi:hypothetical protein